MASNGICSGDHKAASTFFEKNGIGMLHPIRVETLAFHGSGSVESPSFPLLAPMSRRLAGVALNGVVVYRETKQMH
jgi:hypothetical protein